MGSNDHTRTGRLSPGEVFLDRFEVRDFLGAGGEFDVYLARDRAMDGLEVALKVLVLPGDARFGRTVVSTVEDELSARADGLRALWSLHRETLDLIDDPVAIARVLEVSVEGDPSRWFVVEEAVLGAYTLGDWLRIERDPRAVLSALSAVGRLLAMLHERGVVHRDIHGANVMVDARGRLWLTDFSHAIRPMARPSFALLSPWNAPEERTDAPLTATADVYGFAKLSLDAARHLSRSLSDPRARGALLDRLELARARFIECAPDARGSLVCALDELRAIERGFFTPARRPRSRRSGGMSMALSTVAASALAALAWRSVATRAAGAERPPPVTEVRVALASAPLVWREGATARAGVSTGVSAGSASTRPREVRSSAMAASGEFASGIPAFREDAPASERLARYAAESFLSEAALRARRGFGAACLREASRRDPGAPSEGGATFRVTLSPSRDGAGGRVDRVALVRAERVGPAVLECLRARIANIAVADPGRTVDAELSLRLSSPALARR
jgi:hypothetical protein